MSKQEKTNLAQVIKKHFFTKHFLRFLLVGGFNTAADVFIFVSLSAHLKLPTIIANLISTTVVMCISFFLNKHFVFNANTTTRKHVIRFVFWTLVNVWVVQTLIILLAKSALTDTTKNLILLNTASKLVGVSISMVLNFLCYKTIFNTAEQEAIK